MAAWTLHEGSACCSRGVIKNNSKCSVLLSLLETRTGLLWYFPIPYFILGSTDVGNVILLLPVAALNKLFTCSDQPGWHFLLLFTDWILFQPQNVCNHMSACRKCPLCQALLLHDPELEWSQALEGSASAAAQQCGEFLKQCSLQTLAFQLAPAFIEPAEDNTAGCYNSCPLHQINILG